MPIQLLQGDVLGTATDGLILTIDGARRGLDGNIARAFARRWPDDFAEIEDQIRYPVPLGRAVVTRPDLDCPFKAVHVASTLHHLEVLADKQEAGIVTSAPSEAVGLAMRHRVRFSANPLRSNLHRACTPDRALAAIASMQQPAAGARRFDLPRARDSLSQDSILSAIRGHRKERR